MQYLKKIDVRDVQIGMFIAQLDRPWVETPFMYQGFELESQTALDKLRELCRYIWIDTYKGADYVPPARGGADAYARMEQLEEEDKELKARIMGLIAQSRARANRKSYQDTATFEEEIGQAREVEQHAREVTEETFHMAREGKKIDLNVAGRAVTRMVESIIRNPDALICLSQLKEVSNYTALHSVRCCILALAFGRHLALSRDELQVLGLGALLKDVGMVRVPQGILDKQGNLSQEEFTTMQKHVRWGVEIIEESGNAPPGALEVVLQHHERGDGSGYPDFRQGTGITPAGYIGAIVDVYDAVTSDRTYNVAMSAEDALKRMYEWREKDFSAHLVEEFIRCMGIFPIGSLVELSTGSVGVVITINRGRRLKPKVAMVLTAARKPYSYRTVTDLMEHKDAFGKEIKISRVLPTGTFGINPMDHIVQL